MNKLSIGLALLALAGVSPCAALVISPAGEPGVPYATGGVGREERETLQAEAHNYDLKLIFAATGSTAFVADVDVRIYDGSGKLLLQAMSDGPWFYAKLPSGKYRVSVTTLGSTQEKNVTVTAGGKPVQQAFYWRSN